MYLSATSALQNPEPKINVSRPSSPKPSSQLASSSLSHRSSLSISSPWALQHDSVLWGNVSIVTLTLGMEGRRGVHCQGYFQGGSFLGGETANHTDDCAASGVLESLNSYPKRVAHIDGYL